jgi:L-ascorbate metabolism protein UlaG (beta-lactamase superfamily)
MKIKYFGHSCFTIENNNLKILLDPFITQNPLIKMDVMSIEADVILVTHDHEDHLGDAIEISKKTGAPVITIFDIAQELNKFGVSTIGGNLGGTIEYKGVNFTFVKAEHSSTNGVPVGFIITFEDNTVYFAGDTNVFSDMQIIKELYNPNIVMLPIDGRFNMGPKEAAYAVKLLLPKIIIPMHYGTWDILTGTPDVLVKELKKIDCSILNNPVVLVFDVLEVKEI